MSFFPRRRPPGGRARRPVGRAAVRRLRRAHQLLAQGEAKEAAEMLDELAQAALRRGARRAPQVCLEAGRAWLEANDTQRALELFKTGLLQMASWGRIRRLEAASGRILADLRSRGLHQQADELEAQIRKDRPNLDLSAPARRRNARRARLPAICPQCGGPIRPDELSWNDHLSAYCEYCGTRLTAE